MMIWSSYRQEFSDDMIFISSRIRSWWKHGIKLISAFNYCSWSLFLRSITYDDVIVCAARVQRSFYQNTVWFALCRFWKSGSSSYAVVAFLSPPPRRFTSPDFSLTARNLMWSMLHSKSTDPVECRGVVRVLTALCKQCVDKYWGEP